MHCNQHDAYKNFFLLRRECILYTYLFKTKFCNLLRTGNIWWHLIIVFQFPLEFISISLLFLCVLCTNQNRNTFVFPLLIKFNGHPQNALYFISLVRKVTFCNLLLEACQKTWDKSRKGPMMSSFYKISPTMVTKNLDWNLLQEHCKHYVTDMWQ